MRGEFRNTPRKTHLLAMMKQMILVSLEKLNYLYAMTCIKYDNHNREKLLYANPQHPRKQQITPSLKRKERKFKGKIFHFARAPNLTRLIPHKQ